MAWFKDKAVVTGFPENIIHEHNHLARLKVVNHYANKENKVHKGHTLNIGGPKEKARIRPQPLIALR